MTANQSNDQAVSPTSWESRFRSEMEILRNGAGMTQRDLAKVLSADYGLPFHQQTVQRIEGGSRPVRLNEAYAIADVFGVELSNMVAAPLGPTTQAVQYAVDRLRKVLVRMPALALPQLEEMNDRLGDLIEAAFPNGLGGMHSCDWIDDVTIAQKWALSLGMQVAARWETMLSTVGSFSNLGGGGPASVREATAVRVMCQLSATIKRDRPDDLGRLTTLEGLVELTSEMDTLG